MLSPFIQSIVTTLRKSNSYRLSGIIDIASLTPSARDKVQEHVSTYCWPLLQQAQFANLQAAGPWLFSARPGADVSAQYDFLGALDECAERAVCGWIISALAPEQLARHLSQAAVATGPDGHRYLLRYHTATVLKVLDNRRDLPGVRQLFAPIHRWWFPEPTLNPNEQSWRSLTGADQPESLAVPAIHLDADSWAALAGDPLSYHLAKLLRKENTAPAFDRACPGTQIGLIDLYLRQAREHGLTRDKDLITYVLMLACNGDNLADTPAWQQALSATCEQQTALVDNLQTLLPASTR
ncbi:DUF4123 domain-containing protein [Pseudomonas sp. L7]|uniref:DUF4123 domain-containing protein n=1 Tax=Pseudomonas sp. L7 TaxID=3388343 RepID=UPI0039851E99